MIGFHLGAQGDDDDDWAPEPELQVGQGCASLTATPDEREFVRVALKLHAEGATYVRVGECEVRWGGK